MTCFVFCMNIGENVQDVPLPKDRRITDFMKKVFCEYEKIRGTLYLNYLFFKNKCITDLHHLHILMIEINKVSYFDFTIPFSCVTNYKQKGFF